ncbi:MAG: hypothetical protein ABIZ50_04120 [Solirubrobacterales bacterium]
MRIRKGLPSPAMIVACLALIVAIGGSAYAASKINGKQIKSDSITGKQIKEKTVKGVASAKKAKLARDSKRLGGEKGKKYKVRWLLLDELGNIEEQSGGFSVLDGYKTNQNVYIDTGEATEGHGLTATIAINNKKDLYGPVGADTNFQGEVSVARCQTTAVECAPANAKNPNAIVVSPRNSDGSATGAATRKRVYVELTEGPAPAAPVKKPKK